MATRPKMAVGEWYHCYTRGVDKRTVFTSREEYERFLVHMYVANRKLNLRVSDLADTNLLSVLSNPKLQSEALLTEVGAYALMPNHLHFILRETEEGSIASFMQKVFTGYTKYFNNKHDRTGALFASTFKSKHISDDRYFKQVLSYVLLNPVELFEPKWKIGTGDIKGIEKKLLQYSYSSLPEFFNVERPENALINSTLHSLYDAPPSLESMLKTAQEYYSEHAPQV